VCICQIYGGLINKYYNLTSAIKNKLKKMKRAITLSTMLVILCNQFITAGNGKPNSSEKNSIDVVTYSQGKWGGQINDELTMVFNLYFPEGIKLGTENSMVLSSPQAVELFLPSGMSPKPFPFGQITDPGLNYKNALAGELVALSLNLALDDYRKDGASTLLSLIITEGETKGITVEALFIEANRKLGGSYSIYSFNILTEALYAVNRNFAEPGINKGFLKEEQQFAVNENE